MNERKAEWQRQWRAAFKAQHGYSSASNYGAGRLRQSVLERDSYRCVQCGLSDAEHKNKWGRPITIDHKDKNRTNNTMENLQTLCLKCHGQKDITPRLTIPKVPAYKTLILEKRKSGDTYQSIADSLGLSIAAVWKWTQVWKKEELENTQ